MCCDPACEVREEASEIRRRAERVAANTGISAAEVYHNIAVETSHCIGGGYSTLQRRQP